MERPLKHLTDAEDFFRFFRIPYDSNIVMVTRLHILKRFRQYLELENLHEKDPANAFEWEKQRSLLVKAYDDFVRSTPLKEKVFPVFHQGSSPFIPLAAMGRGVGNAD